MHRGVRERPGLRYRSGSWDIQQGGLQEIQGYEDAVAPDRVRHGASDRVQIADSITPTTSLEIFMRNDDIVNPEAITMTITGDKYQKLAVAVALFELIQRCFFFFQFSAAKVSSSSISSFS